MVFEVALDFNCLESFESDIFAVDLEHPCSSIVCHRFCIGSQDFPIEPNLIMDISTESVIIRTCCDCKRIMGELLAIRERREIV